MWDLYFSGATPKPVRFFNLREINWRRAPTLEGRNLLAEINEKLGVFTFTKEQAAMRHPATGAEMTPGKLYKIAVPSLRFFTASEPEKNSNMLGVSLTGMKSGPKKKDVLLYLGYEVLWQANSVSSHLYVCHALKFMDGGPNSSEGLTSPRIFYHLFHGDKAGFSTEKFHLLEPGKVRTSAAKIKAKEKQDAARRLSKEYRKVLEAREAGLPWARHKSEKAKEYQAILQSEPDPGFGYSRWECRRRKLKECIERNRKPDKW